MAAPVTPPVKRNALGRLYHGETSIDFIGKTKLWFTISAVVILVGLTSLIFRGLNFGIDFEGGVEWEADANGVTVAEARDALGISGATIQTVSGDAGVRIRVAAKPLDDPAAESERERDVSAKLAELTGVSVDDVSVTSVGPTWGREISDKAVKALIIFLAAITLYISLRFEFKMAIPTLTALVHDIVITIGIYSLAGFEVTPATVIAVLTILGFSIYDGIVVFDKVDENTRLVSVSQRMSYGDMVNLSLNQTLMRSLNTSITALLPIASLLIVGSFVLGATTLEDFALALLIGLASGAYSSIFIASPLLVILKEREPRYRDLKRRIESRGERKTAVTPAAAAAEGIITEPDTAKVPVGVGVAADGGAADGAPARTRPAGAIPPRPRKKGKRR
jgi:preprotein translocase subunit SecF